MAAAAIGASPSRVAHCLGARDRHPRDEHAVLAGGIHARTAEAVEHAARRPACRTYEREATLDRAHARHERVDGSIRASRTRQRARDPRRPRRVLARHRGEVVVVADGAADPTVRTVEEPERAGAADRRLARHGVVFWYSSRTAPSLPMNMYLLSRRTGASGLEHRVREHGDRCRARARSIERARGTLASSAGDDERRDLVPHHDPRAAAGRETRAREQPPVLAASAALSGIPARPDPPPW